MNSRTTKPDYDSLKEGEACWRKSPNLYSIFDSLHDNGK